MITASITSKGQVTIPKSIRDSLKVTTGDKISFIVSEDGEVIIKPLAKKAAEVFGLLTAVSRKAMSTEEIDNKLEDAFRNGQI
jgi:AbrB family looped-hinge helix DNA binding protein